MEKQLFGTSISVGIAALEPGEHDVATLREQADAALYEAKRTGRNRTCLAPQQETNGSVPHARDPEQTGLG